LLNCCDQELFWDHLPEIRKQNDFEESEESEPKERDRVVLKLTEGLGLTDTDIKTSEDADWNEQQAATRQGVIRMLACYEGILK
jgi:hypothetical protein